MGRQKNGLNTLVRTGEGSGCVLWCGHSHLMSPDGQRLCLSLLQRKLLAVILHFLDNHKIVAKGLLIAKGF